MCGGDVDGRLLPDVRGAGAVMKCEPMRIAKKKKRWGKGDNSKARTGEDSTKSRS